MDVIGFLAQKGGVGKSTLAIHIAEWASRAGLNIVLLDMDKQGTAASWKKRRGGKEDDHLVVIRSDEVELRKHLQMCREFDADLVIIDTMPAVDNLAKLVIEHVDLAIVPMAPSLIDMEAAWATLRMITKASTPYTVVLNGCRTSNAIAVREAKAALQDRGIEFCPTPIVRRGAFCEQVGYGKAGFDANAKALQEINALWQYIQSALPHCREVAA